MARADYFDRAVQAAFHVLNDFDQQAFLKKVDAHQIALAFDSHALTPEGIAALDLSMRLIARFYPSIAIIPLGHGCKDAALSLKMLAKSINPKIAIAVKLGKATDVIVVGKTVPPGDGTVNRYFIGSDGWITRFSRSKPVGSGTSNNPLGAGVAACLAAANIFRRIFSDAKLDDELTFSVLDMDIAAENPRNPVLKDVDIGDTYLAGAGAIGHGFIWGMFGYANLTGKLTLIDHDDIDLFNIQRYALTGSCSEGEKKVDLAADFLSGREGLQVTKFHGKWEDFVSNLPEDKWMFSRVVSALDSPKDRIELQASLPKWVVNGWTGDCDAGVSHHDFINHACLACLYMPSGSVKNEDELILEALGLPPDQLRMVRDRLEKGIPTERAFLELVAKAKNIDVQKMLPFENKPLRELYTKAVCSGAVMELATGSKSTARAEVPMPFQSAFAGILQAAVLIANAAGIASLLGFTRINLMKPFTGANPGTSWTQAKHPRCFCNDEDYKQAYNEKYV
jgi:hypothetical protein